MVLALLLPPLPSLKRVRAEIERAVAIVGDFPNGNLEGGGLVTAGMGVCVMCRVQFVEQADLRSTENIGTGSLDGVVAVICIPADGVLDIDAQGRERLAVEQNAEFAGRGLVFAGASISTVALRPPRKPVNLTVSACAAPTAEAARTIAPTICLSFVAMTGFPALNGSCPNVVS